MKKYVLLIMVLAFSFSTMLADEGMYLLNKLPMKELKAKGLKLSAKEIYNPGKSEATIVIVTGIAVALGIFLANWMDRGLKE